jgi:hypothetical protein
LGWRESIAGILESFLFLSDFSGIVLAVIVTSAWE